MYFSGNIGDNATKIRFLGLLAFSLLFQGNSRFGSVLISKD